MQQSKVYDTEKSFSDTIIKQLSNSTDIETASIADTYNNPDMLYYQESESHLKLFDNILLNKYYQVIKDSCEKLVLDSSLKVKYKYRPEAVSTDRYGTPGLWYIILYINGCECANEFCNMDFILIPSITTIEKCLLNDEYIKNKDVM